MKVRESPIGSSTANLSTAKGNKWNNVGIAIINHPFLMVYTTHKNGDEWGMVYGIAIPTLGSLGLQLQLSIEPWSMGEVTPQPLGCGGPWAPRTVVFSAQSTKFTGETWCACK